MDYPPEDYIDALCEWLSEGRTLAAWCRLPGNPSVRTVHTWVKEHEWVAAAVGCARDLGFGVMADDCVSIADTPEEGVITTIDKDGVKTVSEDMLGHRRLRVDTRLKLLACWDPRRYGNKVAVGGDADAPPIKVLSSVERAHRLQVLLAQVAERAVAPPQLTDDDVMS